MTQATLQNPRTLLVGDIKGDFYIPSYQRGYRWKEQVKVLLEDLAVVEQGCNYCLQPIVVKQMEDGRYELIDGQQRLTTIYLLLQYLKATGIADAPNFSLEYETRTNSKYFIENIENIENYNLNDSPDNIDELFISNAFCEISAWFGSRKKSDVWEFFNKLEKHIYVIWHEIDSSEDAIALFTRLNIGKIPLTNAELIKALFLRRSDNFDLNKQKEISADWDRIEQELRDDSFWYFLTNAKSTDYDTRIELIFDLIANNQADNRERFATFYHFDKEIKDPSRDKKKVWDDIYAFYQKTKELYKNNNLYHKVGYLIASNTKKMNELMVDIQDKKKSELDEYLLLSIRESILDKEKRLDGLSYGSDDKLISKILLLFNVETIRQKEDDSLKFSFEKYKHKKWSLEHIHAQQTEGLNKKEQWDTWLNMHLNSLISLNNPKNNELIAEVQINIDNDSLDRIRFDALSEKVIKALSSELESNDDLHTLSNLALLDIGNNSILSNSTFDVKRNKIIEMDRNNDYIPVCTRQIFLKYYTASDVNQLHFWSREDRKAYMDNIKRVLSLYLVLENQEIQE